jgi:hypothetical protein
VNRNLSGDPSATASDIVAAGSDEGSLSLVTDPALYAEYPMQKAVRMASVVFDYGDARATRVLNDLVDKVVSRAKAITQEKTDGEIATSPGRNLILEEGVEEVNGWSADVIAAADVADTFGAFLGEVKETVPDIANSPSLTTGDLPSGWIFFSSAGASLVAGSRA